MSALPSHIGRYPILGLLGTGGMAEVFLGRVHGPSGFQRPVVIKRILPHLAREQHFVDMFLDEARIVAGIHHQNVVNVHELGNDDGELFLVMEYLEGESTAGLARRLSTRRKLLSFGLSAHIMAEICAGLHAAHQLKDIEGRSKNLVHRDVSPANIFVTYSGEVKVLDFGIAVAADRISRTEAGQVKGKYAYMSPEQCQAQPLDARSDLFSCGTVLYELSTCRRLFKRDSDMLTLQAVCYEDIIPPSQLVSNYPMELERVVMKALERDRDQRYQSGLEMRRDLLAVSRLLNQDKVPEESLSRVMRKLFDDRIQEKRALLTQLADGIEITHVPAADTDASIEIPGVKSEPVVVPLPRLMSSIVMRRAMSSVPSGGSRWGWKIGVLVVMLLVMSGTAFLTIGGTGSAGAHQSGHVSEGLESLPTSPIEPTPMKAAPSIPEPTSVRLSFESTPSGAEVFIDGKLQGKAPLTIERPKGQQAMKVVLRLKGYDELVDQIVPNENQRFRLALLKKKAPSKRTVRSKSSRTVRPPPSDEDVDTDPYNRFD